MKKIIILALITLAFGCAREADRVSENISREADSFNILRRVVFYNGITNEYILTLEGFCSIGNNDKHGQLTVTCKSGKGQYKKHFLGLSDNVTYFAEQIDSANVSEDHYKVIFRPKSIVPDIEVR